MHSRASHAGVLLFAYLRRCGPVLKANRTLKRSVLVLLLRMQIVLNNGCERGQPNINR